MLTSWTQSAPCRGLFSFAIWISLISALRADIFATDQTNNQVLRYDAQSGSLISVFVDVAGGLNRPIGLAFGGDGNLYVANNGGHGILRFNGSTGAFIDEFVPSGDFSPIRFPYDMVFGPNGNLYVTADAMGGPYEHIYEIDKSTGDVLRIFESGANLRTPFDIEFGPQGNLFVVDRTRALLQEFHGITGQYIRDVVAQQPNVDPWSFTFEPGGDLLVASNSSSRVHRFDSATGNLIGAFDEFVSFSGPDTIALGPGGRAFVYNFNSKRLVGVDVDTELELSNFSIPAASHFVFWPVPEPTTGALSFAILALTVLPRAAARTRLRGAKH